MRIVVKVGSNVLTDNSYQIKHAKVKQIVDQIAEFKSKGREVILVSSGAVGSGRERLPKLNISQKKQVWAAVGQPLLMDLYKQYFTKYKISIGQCLLLRNDFTDRERYDNFVGTIEGLLKAGVLPIINENDVVAMADLTVGDNDLLAAMVAVAVAAEKLVLLTNQKGLYTSNPDTDPQAELISEVANVDFELEKLCSKEVSTLGRGGMLSKVRAAKHAVHAGIETYIADGRDPRMLSRLFKGKANSTKFIVRYPKVMTAQKRWLLSAKGFGQLIIDDGAAKALQNNKSLLMPGIIGAKGLFDRSEIVEIISKQGLAVAYGKVNYDNNDIQAALIKRKMNDKKFRLEKEVVHRDYMAVLHN